jgi:hypothetical protein
LPPGNSMKRRLYSQKSSRSNVAVISLNRDDYEHIDESDLTHKQR